MKYLILIKIILGCALLASWCASQGQEVPNFNALGRKTLSIGDTIPNFTINKVINGENNIRPFRGKWLIIDFWETYCAACINAMPELRKLQDKFKDDIHILLVSRSSEQSIKSFLEKSAIAKNSELPIAPEDTTLITLFPHRIIPHEIWIDPEGIVRGITSGEEVNEENIERVLANSRFSLPTKRDEVNWDINTTLGGVIENQSDFIFQSVLVKYKEGVPSGAHFGRDSTGLINHVYFFNIYPLKMYYYAFSFLNENTLGNLNVKRVQVEVSDSSRFYRFANSKLEPYPFAPRTFPYLGYNSREDWIADNHFSYDLKLPKGISDSLLLEYVFNDLNRYFPIKCKIEKMKAQCWVLQSSESSKQLLSGTGGESGDILTSTAIGVKMKTLDEFIDLIEMSSEIDPIVNETGITELVDIEVDFSESKKLDRRQGLVINNTIDISLFKKQLAKYGLTLTKSERYTNMLVVYDNDNWIGYN